ncbi:MAG: type II secretion system protein, partial [Acidimicrobiia bacterium]|nr:type II secretion system protein [Acidimicrobiia bacterium]
MCSRESSRDTRDRGMTLVELLVTVTILGVIMSSLAA